MEIFCGNSDLAYLQTSVNGNRESRYPYRADDEKDVIQCLNSHELPDHILLDLFTEFMDDPVDNQVRLSTVCRRWANAFSDAQMWAAKLKARFGHCGTLHHPRFRSFSGSECWTSSETDFHPKQVYGATHSLERSFSRGNFISRSRCYWPSVVTSVAISPKGIFVGDVDGKVSKHGTPFEGDWGVIQQSHSCSSAVSSLCSPAGEYDAISGHSDGSIAIWRDSSLASVQIHEASSRVTAMASSHGSLLSVSSSDLSLRATDINAGSVQIMRRFGFSEIPNSIAVFPNCPEIVVVGFRDECARIFDVRTRNDSLEFKLSDWCLCVETSSQDANKIRASDKAVNLFDLRKSGEAVEERHRGKRLVSRFKSDSTLRLVSCGLDGEVKVSSLETAPPLNAVSITTSEDYILAVDFDRTTLVCGGMSGKLELFAFN